MNYHNHNLNGFSQLPTYHVNAPPTCGACNNSCVTMPHDTGQRHQFTETNRSKTLTYVLKKVYILSPVEISDVNDVIPVEQYVHTPTCNNSQLYMYKPQYIDQINQQSFQNPPQDIRNAFFPQRNHLKTFVDCAPISSSIANTSMMAYNNNYDMTNASNIQVSQPHTATLPYDTQYTDHANQQNFQSPSHYAGNT
jgi:hypothetical protein